MMAITRFVCLINWHFGFVENVLRTSFEIVATVLKMVMTDGNEI